MASEATAKRLKAGEDAITIGTHSGAFHADEALAVHMLRAHVPLYAGARLVRTRDPDALQACHTVVDVGGEYEPARNRFDHHQRSFTTTFPGRPTKLSSAGLVYMHFGRGIIARRLLLLGKGNGDSDAAEAVTAAAATVAQDSSNIDDAQQNNDQVGLIWRKLYEAFIEAADAHDNGIAQYDPAGLAAAGLEKRFSAGGFTLGAMVARLNGMWNDDSAPGDAQVAEDGRFELASRRIGEELDRALDFYTRGWMPARAIVAEAYAARRTHDPDGRIVVLPGGKGVPWKEHIFSLEEEDEAAAAAEKNKGATSRVLYVLYKEGSAPDARWRMQCMPESQDSFQSRKPLPEAWRGLRDEELDNVSGIDGCMFVHASGFTGGNKTHEGAMAMVKKSMAL